MATTTSTREQTAAALEAFRAHMRRTAADDLPGFVRTVRADPDATAAEVVDYAADHLDADIDYDWDTPHELRDAIYNAAGDWARELTQTRMTRPVRAADLPSLDYVTARRG